ncbi:hypothetical protein EON65_12485 [archaeon]|nr:MAG: hypothetical protein EON65_12485 [archaeon]
MSPERIPNARLGSEVPLAHTSVFGSSQLSGCQGDFCDFNLHTWEPKTISRPKSKQQQVQSSKGDYRKALYKAGLLEHSIDDSVTGQDMMRIGYHSILLARQQAPLVKLFLERHMRGDDAPLVLQDNYMDFAVAGKLPAHYYQDVPCCMNCYQIYNIIDRARSKSIRPHSVPDKVDLKEDFLSGSESVSLSDAKEYLSTNLTSFQTQQLASLGRRREGSPGSSITSLDARPNKKSRMDQTMKAAYEAIEGLTKMDVAEIRSMVKPPAAVEVVIEAVMILLTGKYMNFKDSYKLLSGGEAFLTMLKDFDVADVTDKRLAMVEHYVDNPLFRPEHVLPVSHCASKFCAWVHGVVHAARHMRGVSHQRIETIKPKQTSSDSSVQIKTQLKPIRSVTITAPAKSKVGSAEEELSFVQKLEKIKAMKNNISSPSRNLISREGSLEKKSLSLKKPLPTLGEKSQLQQPSVESISMEELTSLKKTISGGPRLGSKFDPGPVPSFADTTVSTPSTTLEPKKKLTKREMKAMKAMQTKSIERLSAQTAIEGSVGVVGASKLCVCSDGITRMPYVVMGKFSPNVEKCNFVVVHDFFDTYDATAILYKQLVQRHSEGCQVLCYNYPGQAHTLWPRLTQIEKDRGAKEPVLSNDWQADRLHELLKFAESSGDILLSRPFHLVGIGNGACVAAAFCQRYAYHDMYVNSLRSVVSVNGFLYPDAQLASILHASSQVFESTPHSRPDIAVSYWSRYIFSEDYLTKVNPNLALNIYTAVSNPITNDGRVKIVRGALSSKDLRGSLCPDTNTKMTAINAQGKEVTTTNSRFQPIQVPLIVLQSTEDSLVHASNVDSFLVGRHSKHLWSHMLNVPTEEQMARTFDVTAQWVGRMSSSPDDYSTFSTLGKAGLSMLMETLRNSRGAFVMWARTGHIIHQEYKAAFLDLMDALTCPTEDYLGLNIQTEDPPRLFPGSVIEDEVDTLPSKVLPALTMGDIHPLDALNTSTMSTALVPIQEIKDEENGEHIDMQQEDEETPLSIDDAIDNILKNVQLPTLGASGVAASELDDDDDILSFNEVARTKSPDIEMAVGFIRSITSLDKQQRQPSNSEITPELMSPASSYASRQNTEKDLSAFWNNPEVNKHVSPEKSPSKEIVSSPVQRSKHEWISTVPDASTALALEAQLRVKQLEYLELEEKLRKLKAEQEGEQIPEFKRMDEEELAKLEELSEEVQRRQKERDLAEMQRKVKIREVEDMLVNEGVVPPFPGLAVVDILSKGTVRITEPVRDLPPMHYSEPAELPKAIVEGKDVISKLDQMLKDEEEARRRGVLSMHEFEKIKMQMAERQLERDQKLRSLSVEELHHLQDSCAISIQRVVRGFTGRRRAKKKDANRKLEREQRKRILQIQAVCRGFLGRKRYKRLRVIYLASMRGEHSARNIQRMFRGFADRKFFTKIKRRHCATQIQRTFRGYLGRNAHKREKKRLELLRKKFMAASKIQSVWRMKVCKEEYRSLRIHILAAIEIQRYFRGYLGRKKMARKRLWQNTKPGPERIKLGLQFIEESKQAFERQQEEIDALHRAQERAEARVSHIHAELKDSEKELVVLERELQEIDQIERDLQVLSHERTLLSQGIEDAAGLPRLAGKGHKDLVMGRESVHENDPMAERKRRAEAYALEMTIQLKRAEREKKRQELEIEFAAVFQEVEKKRKALQRLEMSLADMEATRERKDREFRRLQKNLMQLLLEQKQELDDLREKGLELETATATTAAAAVATAQKAKEHEKRSNAMFSQTEELMKFQFMSMSLSYFSSLNMLKSLREMNADTTSAAIALSADASSTAASAAAAANLPNIQKLHLGANDFVEASIRKKKEEILAAEKAEKELAKVVNNPLPPSVKTWSVHDVGRWLDSLALTQYKDAFQEGSVDGPFLLELREEDLVQVLGIKHRLHVRKILISREKLKPLSQQEMQYKEVVEREVKHHFFFNWLV